MRLTADLIQASISFINPVGDRELELRGHKIPAIENLGVAGNHNDAIDFTDNDITILGNFPLSPRLRVLMCARNRIAQIAPTFPKNLPNLDTIILTQNSISELSDLEPLAHLPLLRTLSLMENPVTNKEHYRNWVIFRMPTVLNLDFQRVRKVERGEALELFGTAQKPTALTQKILSIKSRQITTDASAPNGTASNVSRLKLTARERTAIQERIKNAKTMDEVVKLEKMLNEGKIPGGAILELDSDTMAM